VAQLAPQPWPQPSGQASTVLRWIDSEGWQMLRRGAVVPAELRNESC
jgi:L-threonylcarbamoyladenylate synthase